MVLATPFTINESSSVAPTPSSSVAPLEYGSATSKSESDVFLFADINLLPRDFCPKHAVYSSGSLWHFCFLLTTANFRLFLSSFLFQKSILPLNFLVNFSVGRVFFPESSDPGSSAFSHGNGESGNVEKSTACEGTGESEKDGGDGRAGDSGEVGLDAKSHSLDLATVDSELAGLGPTGLDAPEPMGNGELRCLNKAGTIWDLYCLVFEGGREVAPALLDGAEFDEAERKGGTGGEEAIREAAVASAAALKAAA